ncbi:hypothetical protein NKI36_13850 [Mesorhizobium caraganae]|uniref:Uncharacterized protein n=1 Tax=Mesorhizobium caraganae TaxID=483206 RepID=A0ABV1YZX4_9HYPH
MTLATQFSLDRLVALYLQQRQRDKEMVASGGGERRDDEGDAAGLRECKARGTFSTVALHGAPLCPAGHLPHGWGDWPSSRLSPTFNLAELAGRQSR